MPKSYLEFHEMAPVAGKKTKVVSIYSVSGGYQLGQVRWHAPWRQYCFFPDMSSIWNTGCLDEIQAKIKELMEEGKK